MQTRKSERNIKHLLIETYNTIRTNHKYYSEIQGQMSVLERYYCNLFIWTPIENSTDIAIVIRDDKFCKSILQTTKQYFFDILLPKVVKRKFDVLAENKQ